MPSTGETVHQKEVFISIKNKKDIQKLFSRGEKYSSRHLYVRYLRIDHSGDVPLSVVMGVPKKMGKAHVRNYYKRSLRESLFLALKGNFPKKDNTSSVMAAIIPNSSFIEIPFETRVEEMKSFLAYIFAASRTHAPAFS